MMAALFSMNLPMMNSAAFTPSRNMVGDFSTSCSHMPMASGTPARVMMKANRPALAMMNMITALEMTDLRSTGSTSLNDSSRWISMPTISA